MDVARDQGVHYHTVVVYFLSKLDKEGSKELIVLRVRSTPTKLSANVLYTPVDSTQLHS